MIKKILFIVCILFSISVHAENCAGNEGKVYRLKNGTRLCQSRKEMVYEDANKWCKKLGGTLLPLDDYCSEEDMNCKKLKGGKGQVWMKDNGKGYAFWVGLETGNVDGGGFVTSHLVENFALCINYKK